MVNYATTDDILASGRSLSADELIIANKKSQKLLQ